MNFKNESAFNRHWSKVLELMGAIVFPIVGGEMQQPGWPDRLVLHRKWSGFIEGKTGNGRLTAMQQVRHRRCLERGFPALVLTWQGSDQNFELGVVDVTGDAGIAVLYVLPATLLHHGGVHEGLSILDWFVKATRDLRANSWLWSEKSRG